MLPFYQALDALYAERIGHGYHVIDDEEVYKRVLADKVHLEVTKFSKSD